MAAAAEPPNQLEKPPATATIDSLPNSLLFHILSLLPTKTAVSTSILSRRWRHLWEHLQVFHFSDDRSFFNDSSRFAAFVNGVLGRVREIEEFRLSCHISNADANWIRSAVRPQLQQLHLSLRCSLSSVFLGMRCCELPHSFFFTCSSLVSLTLEGCVLAGELPPVHLPSLKQLDWRIISDGPIDELLSGCPVLEILNLAIDISIRSLRVPPPVKRLTLKSDVGIQNLDFDTPALEYIDMNLVSALSLSCSINMNNLVEAHIEIEAPHPHVLTKLLRSLCKTKILVLKTSWTSWYSLPEFQEFPDFCRLLHLQVSGFLVDGLLHSLHKCPMLQVLKIDEMRLKETDEPSILTLPSTVPECVMSKLATFELSVYAELPYENALIEYILQRGLVLKTVRISPLKSKKKDHILKELSTIPRGSSLCQLKVD